MQRERGYSYADHSEPNPVVSIGSPVRVLLLGAPGVGKGTQAKELKQVWGIPHISTGELLRAHVRENTSLGLVAREMMARGELIPDLLVAQMVAARLEEPDAFNGFILDGFPRTLSQATWLDSRLSEAAIGASPIAISLKMDDEYLRHRITGRRNCPVCQTTFNIYVNPPSRDGYCDKDGSALMQRDDDTEKVFEERMRTYWRLSAPVVEHYRGHGRFAEVCADRPVEEIAGEIAAAVDQVRIQLD